MRCLNSIGSCPVKGSPPYCALPFAGGVLNQTCGLILSGTVTLHFCNSGSGEDIEISIGMIGCAAGKFLPLVTPRDLPGVGHVAVADALTV
jgi:hypothetical protein